MDRISVNPDIHFGKPCITGTRITIIPPPSHSPYLRQDHAKPDAVGNAHPAYTIVRSPQIDLLSYPVTVQLTQPNQPSLEAKRAIVDAVTVQ